jgi:hypothetical protein
VQLKAEPSVCLSEVATGRTAMRESGQRPGQRFLSQAQTAVVAAALDILVDLA